MRQGIGNPPQHGTPRPTEEELRKHAEELAETWINGNLSDCLRACLNGGPLLAALTIDTLREWESGAAARLLLRSLVAKGTD